MHESSIRQAAARLSLSYYSEYLGYRNAPFQLSWYERLQPKNDPLHFSPLREHPNALKRFHLEGPRKHSKSETHAINYPSWLIGKYPNIHILLVSKTDTLSSRTVNAIKQRVEHDEKYLQVFGDLKPKNPQMWTDSAFIIKRREISKFPTLSSCGIGGSGALTGGGFDLIIADDIIDEENVDTENQREKSSNWFHKVLLTTLFPWGGCFVIGTRWHHQDLYSELLLKWRNEVQRAVLNEAEILKGAVPRVLWADVWSYERLMEVKRELGTIIFDCQYQNNPTSLEGKLLRGEWLHPYGIIPSNLVYYAGVDPALGEGDQAAIATIAYDHENMRGYLVDVWSETVDFPIFLRKLNEKFGTYGYSKIFIESNSFQKVLTWLPQLGGLPMVPTITDANKERRIIPMSSHFEGGRIEVRNTLRQSDSEFYKQWVQFPRGEHDDALDAVEICVRNITSQLEPAFGFGK